MKAISLSIIVKSVWVLASKARSVYR